MYIIIEKDTEKAVIIKEKTTLAEYLNLNRGTIYNKQHLNKWETEKHIIYLAYEVKIRSKRGGKNSLNFR